MDNLVKSFSFNCENVTLTLNILKEISSDAIIMSIRGELTNENEDLDLINHVQEDKGFYALKYKGTNFFSMSNRGEKFYRISNNLSWGNYISRKNENRVGVYRYNNIEEMIEKYIILREYVTKVSDYFYSSIKNYKEKKMLYETDIDDVYKEK